MEPTGCYSSQDDNWNTAVQKLDSEGEDSCLGPGSASTHYGICFGVTSLIQVLFYHL